MCSARSSFRLSIPKQPRVWLVLFFVFAMLYVVLLSLVFTFLLVASPARVCIVAPRAGAGVSIVGTRFFCFLGCLLLSCSRNCARAHVCVCVCACVCVHVCACVCMAHQAGACVVCTRCLLHVYTLLVSCVHFGHTVCRVCTRAPNTLYYTSCVHFGIHRVASLYTCTDLLSSSLPSSLALFSHLANALCKVVFFLFKHTALLPFGNNKDSPILLSLACTCLPRPSGCERCTATPQ
jgi:hypothetical protein